MAFVKPMLGLIFYTLFLSSHTEEESVLQLVYSDISQKPPPSLPPSPQPARPLPQLRGTNALSGFPGLHLFLPSHSSRHPGCPSFSYKPGPSPAQGLPFMVLFLLEKSSRHAYGFLPCPIHLLEKRPDLATHLQRHMPFFPCFILVCQPLHMDLFMAWELAGQKACSLCLGILRTWHVSVLTFLTEQSFFSHCQLADVWLVPWGSSKMGHWPLSLATSRKQCKVNVARTASFKVKSIFTGPGLRFKIWITHFLCQYESQDISSVLVSRCSCYRVTCSQEIHLDFGGDVAHHLSGLIWGTTSQQASLLELLQSLHLGKSHCFGGWLCFTFRKSQQPVPEYFRVKEREPWSF